VPEISQTQTEGGLLVEIPEARSFSPPTEGGGTPDPRSRNSPRRRHLFPKDSTEALGPILQHARAGANPGGCMAPLELVKALQEWKLPRKMSKSVKGRKRKDTLWKPGPRAQCGP
jgi:hypothetical protein